VRGRRSAQRGQPERQKRRRRRTQPHRTAAPGASWRYASCGSACCCCDQPFFCLPGLFDGRLTTTQFFQSALRYLVDKLLSSRLDKLTENHRAARVSAPGSCHRDELNNPRHSEGHRPRNHLETHQTAWETVTNAVR
jgi:hypothetical protein